MNAELPAAQPAAEGAREDDGLAALADVIASEGWCCDPYGHDDGPPSPGECGDCDRLREDTARAILASDWLAEDRRRARAEGGAEALDAVLYEGDDGNEFGPQGYLLLCKVVRRARDRAAGMRETGGKG